MQNIPLQGSAVVNAILVAASLVIGVMVLGATLVSVIATVVGVNVVGTMMVDLANVLMVCIQSTAQDILNRLYTSHSYSYTVMSNID